MYVCVYGCIDNSVPRAKCLYILALEKKNVT